MPSNLIIVILLLVIIILAIFCLKLYKKISMLNTSSQDSNSNVQKSIDINQDGSVAEQSAPIDNLNKTNLSLSEENDKLKNEIENYKETIKNIKIASSSYSDKTLKSSYILSNGVKNGEERLYFKGNAILNKIKNWNKGTLEGTCITYYKTGEKYIESDYKEGNLNGNYTVYNKDGSIKLCFQYKNGEIE